MSDDRNDRILASIKESRDSPAIPKPPTGQANLYYKNYLGRQVDRYGGYTRALIADLGVTWPLCKGWKKRLYQSWRSGKPIIQQTRKQYFKQLLGK